MSKQNVSTFTASKSAGKLYFSLISGVKMPQICSICEKSAYYMAESGVKSTLSAVQSGILGEIRSISGIEKRKAQSVCHMVAEKNNYPEFPDSSKD